MSSAAKLRKFGRGTAVVASAALVMTSFGPAAFASWDDAPQTPEIEAASTAGTIGIADTDPGANNAPADNHGATMVEAGKSDQAIADVVFTLPNRFKSGDIIDLRLLDRSAVEEADGYSNSGPDTLVGFSAAPKVAAVDLANDDAVVSADTENAAKANTESDTANPWVPAGAAGSLTATKPSVAPTFDVSIGQTNGVQGNDNLRLRITSNASDGDPNARWVVRLSDLKVTLGSKVTPGELRLVPFASNKGVSDSYTDSPWFNGNSKYNNSGTPDIPGDDRAREIGIYTVPAYVLPVKVAMERPEIVADGLGQSVGALTITETQPFALQNGSYRLLIDGAQVANPASKDIKVEVTNGGTGETVTLGAIVNNAATNTAEIPFTLAGTDNTKISTITVSGLQLSTTTAGQLKFTVDGGSITGNGTENWLTEYAGDSTLQITGLNGPSILPDSAFLSSSGTAAGQVEGPRTLPTVGTYQATLPTAGAANTAPTSITAATPLSNVLPAGTYSVTQANGVTTLTNGGTVLVNTAADPTVFTAQANVPGAGGVTADSYTVAGLDPDITSFDLAAPTNATAANGDPTQTLPLGAYAYADTAAGGGVDAGDTLTNGAYVLTLQGGGAWTDTAGNAFTIPAAQAAGFQVTNGAASNPQPGTEASSMTATPGSGAPANLPAATYTVSADGLTISGSGIVMTRPSTSSTTFTVSDNGGIGGIDVNDQYTVTGVQPNTQFVVGSGGAITSTLAAPVTAQNAGDLPTSGDVSVAAGTTPGTFDLTGAISATEVRNGVPVDVDGNGPGGLVTFNGLAAGITFALNTPPAVTTLPESVNQQDIVPNLDDLVTLGIARSETARIGGNNRYETAAKIAEQWAGGDKSNTHGKVKNAIIASGENFPDALSASYLSQRMGAPILLTQRGSLPQDTIEALRDRQVDKVFIVGGPAAVSRDVQEQLANLNTYRWSSSGSDWDDRGGLETTGAKLSVQRLSSANPQNDTRYTTNQLINMYAAAWGGNRTIGKTVYKAGEAGKYTAIFARGDNFPDALAAGVLTAGIQDTAVLPVNQSNDNALPLILTTPDSLSQSAVDMIDRLDVEHGIVVGSENALTDGVKKSIEDKGVTTNRIGGQDRYFTAAAVDEYAMRSATPSASNEFPGLGFIGNANNDGTFNDDVTAFLANGLKFPDALTASPWVGRTGNALNLTMGTNDLSDGTRDFLTKRAADVDRAIALGLGDAVSTKVLNEANKIASSK